MLDTRHGTNTISSLAVELVMMMHLCKKCGCSHVITTAPTTRTLPQGFTLVLQPQLPCAAYVAMTAYPISHNI